MLHRLCGPPSIPLSFTLACVLPRRHAYRVSCGTPGCPGTPSVHRLQRGLPGDLILFASRAFEPQRQYVPSWLPSPSVFFLISTHSTALLRCGNVAAHLGALGLDFCSAGLLG